jgi:phage antirepressor YoqD-like protein
MSNLIKHTYNGFDIEFELIDGHVMANATAMCKANGKNVGDWLRLQSTEEYAVALAKKYDMQNPISAKKGGSTQGTWVHERILIDLARWISVDFAIWCDEKIVDLIRPKAAPVKLPANYIEALKALLTSEEEKLVLQYELSEAKPKIEFFDQVADSKDAIEIGQAAKVLNMGIGRNTLFEILRDNAILMHNNAPYQKYLDRGWFRVVEQSYQKPDGTNCINIKTLVYQKGLQEIAKVIQNRRGVAIMDN